MHKVQLVRIRKKSRFGSKHPLKQTRKAMSQGLLKKHLVLVATNRLRNCLEFFLKISSGVKLTSHKTLCSFGIKKNKKFLWLDRYNS